MTNNFLINFELTLRLPKSYDTKISKIVMSDTT